MSCLPAAKHSFTIHMKTNTRGFLLIETLVYITVLVLLLGATTYFLVSTITTYRSTLAAARTDQVGLSIVNELVRTTRESTAVVSADSVFNTALGTVALTQNDNTTSVYTITNGVLTRNDDGGEPVPLTPAGLTISRFYLTQYNTPVSQAIRFDIGVDYESASGTVTRYSRSVAILRPTYE
mgnify:CR=1 FL=1